jgi:hypothetical protein
VIFFCADSGAQGWRHRRFHLELAAGNVDGLRLIPMQSKAETVEDYLAGIPPDRGTALREVLAVIRRNLQAGFEEGMQYGMIGWYVPHRIFPAGYHCDPKQPLPFAALASQKSHLALYMGCLYGDSSEVERFRQQWAATGKKLDMGKSCIRFKKVEDLPLEVIGEAFARISVARFVADYEQTRIDAAAGKFKKK